MRFGDFRRVGWVSGHTGLINTAVITANAVRSTTTAFQMQKWDGRRLVCNHPSAPINLIMSESKHLRLFITFVEAILGSIERPTVAPLPIDYHRQKPNESEDSGTRSNFSQRLVDLSWRYDIATGERIINGNARSVGLFDADIGCLITITRQNFIAAANNSRVSMNPTRLFAMGSDVVLYKKYSFIFDSIVGRLLLNTKMQPKHLGNLTTFVKDDIYNAQISLSGFHCGWTRFPQTE